MLAGVMLVLAGTVYASPLVEFVHDGPVSPQDSYLSELSARSQPGSWAFRLADGLAGALLLAAAVRRSRARRPPWAPSPRTCRSRRSRSRPSRCSGWRPFSTPPSPSTAP
ncbi:DUF998 domain-containing protein [Corynebacterium bovis]|uniref:DUF998 domain-containing protein n=1 Tax=Corynebacterium bovis TaxID=36808 RepID=UPI00264E9915|nr:DUF998 domain-containing protein [Corynebacterium bovis]MDN8580302.1 DUF998 domain-containing protein [Corynebacterium bovis]